MHTHGKWNMKQMFSAGKVKMVLYTFFSALMINQAAIYSEVIINWRRKPNFQIDFHSKQKNIFCAFYIVYIF